MVISVWWSLGQVVTALILWGLLPNYSCSDTATECLSKDNKVWRYFMFSIEGLTLLMFSARFVFLLYESPTLYLARNKDERVIETLKNVARVKKKSIY